MLVDAHCHVYEFAEEELRRYASYRIICVSEDLESSLKSLELGERFSNIIPFVGLHPWNVPETPQSKIKEMVELIERREVAGLGEIGLDRRMCGEYEKQKEVFEKFCELASEYDLPVNIHALDAWEEAVEILNKYDVERSVFHWYNGPIELLDELLNSGYMITINPAVKIQRRHRLVLEEVRLEMIMTESDGPYRYRGLYLKPDMIPDLLDFIADVKNIRRDDLEELIESNFLRFLK
ncbi:MAG: TatD family hydrolase [Nitrososphaeria archaeon]|nr:TatD family hydrolase [Aigarchaeota archaeon]MCX8187311.1 TatD family hydrolase [Nitrososphaeria archaeon]MDW8021404.1 TatD family hydrolase [Nitrososphaerota archaeon]